MQILSDIPSIPTAAEMTSAAQARTAQQLAALDAPGAFLAISLDGWMKQALAAGIPVVPGVIVAHIDRSAWEHSEDPTPEQQVLLTSFLAHCRAAVAPFQPGEVMLRWDFCAGLPLKSVLSNVKWSESDRAIRARTLLDLDDPRAFDLLYDVPLEQIPVWRRPWIAARHVAGYPLEFRVFVRENQIQGISSYYPQRPLPDTAEIREAVEQSRSIAQTLLDSMAQAGAYPWMLGYEKAFDRPSINASIDILIDEAGQARFLEAGPAAGFGAHPCAFLGSEISGVALALAEGVSLLA